MKNAHLAELDLDSYNARRREIYSIRNSPSPCGINIQELHIPRRQLHATSRLHAGLTPPPPFKILCGTAAPGRDMPLTTGSLGYGSMLYRCYIAYSLFLISGIWLYSLFLISGIWLYSLFLIFGCFLITFVFYREQSNGSLN